MMLQPHQYLGRMRTGTASRRGNAALCQPHPATARRQHGAAAQAVQQELDTLQDEQGAIVKLSVPYSTPFGYCIKAVGSLPELGNWNVQAAPSLEWTDGDIWVGDLRLPPGTHEFKVVVAGPRGEVNWEPCGNRLLEVPDIPGVLDVPCSWGNMQMEVLFASDVADQQLTRARSPSPVPIPAQIDAAVGLQSSDGIQTATVLEPAAAVAAAFQDTYRRSRSPSPVAAAMHVQQGEAERAQSSELVTAQQRSPSVGRGRQAAPDANSDAADYTQRQTRQALAFVTCLSIAVAAVIYYKDPEGFPVSLPTSLPTNLQVSIPVSLPTSLPSISLPTSLPNIRLPTSLPAPPTFNLPAMFSVADSQR